MRSTAADNGLLEPAAGCGPSTVRTLRAPARVLILDANALVRGALGRLVGGRPGFEVVSACDDPHGVIERARAAEPDVVLLNLSARGVDPLELAERLTHCHPRPAIVVLSAFLDEQRAREASAAGVTGWVLKDASPEELFAALSRAAAASRAWLRGTAAARTQRATP
jgi:DNA-binding NarL/FixJ family response regulator